MQITRHNYETFLLLYADDELCNNDKAAVEMFLEENKDLQVELDLFLAAKLKPASIVYDFKTSLYKKESELITDDLQEKILLSIDNELKDSEQILLQKMLTENENYHLEYDAFLKTKLDAEELIEFKHKAVLYKKTTRVIPISFMRWAVAAVFVGVVLFFGVKIFDTNDLPKDIVRIPNNNKIITERNTPKKDLPYILPEEQNILDNSIVAKSTNVKYIKNEKSVSSTQTTVSTKTPLKKDIQEIISKQKVEDENLIAITNPKKIENISSKITEPVIDNNIFTENKTLIAKNEVDESLGTPVSVNANTYLLDNDEDETRRTKTGGFLKRLKRTVERTAGIKPGSSLKIAGFELASN